MTVWAIAHAAITAVFSIIVGWEFGREALMFLLLGSLLSFANIGLLYFAWKRIAAKKSVALAVGVIVLKYGITLYLIYKVAKLGLYPLGWTAAGLGLFMLSALSMASLSPKWRTIRSN